MKKLLSLLAAIMLVCCCLAPACAEVPSVAITLDEFTTAMNALSSGFLGWDMTWEPDGNGFIFGNMRSNPMLVMDGDNVSMASVIFIIKDGEDLDTLTDLFIITCTLVGAVPAVRDGVDPTAAPDMVFSDLTGLLGSLTVESPSAVGALYGVPCVLSVSEDSEGVSMSLMLLYTVPEN